MARRAGDVEGGHGFARRWLGIDIGGTKIALVVGDAAGRVLAQHRRPFAGTSDPTRDVSRLIEDARALLAQAGVAPGALAAVGVAAPGPLDPGTGRVLGPPNLPGWSDVPIARVLGAALGAPVLLENDANAAALAEARFGAGRGARDVVYLTMSTGVGAGIVLDGRVNRGAACMAGEIGHAPVEWEGRACRCGRRGCLEAYVGGAAWGERLRATTPETSAVLSLAAARERIAPEHVVEAARHGDAFARAELAAFVEWLARGIVSLAFLLAPEVVVLGTIASAAGETLCFEPLRRRVAARLWPGMAERMRIVPAALGTELPLLAALCVAQAEGDGPACTEQPA